ncbi:DHH family phosphoesterase [Aquibacillus sediminis]|uniref:DHH family phosphoesterase n=1 Tax=Aquibacillus sediminis TaxID=2574734 RepID=UPI0011087549|nr:oligoribonuclease [Aquibacillus sediminis]
MYKLLSHNDLDGVGCGILAKIAFDNQVQVRYNSIGSLNREVEYFLENDQNDTFLLITDLSVNEENEKKLQTFYQGGGKVQLLDHHKTALHFNEYEWGSVKVEDEQNRLTSATSLLYQYLLSNNHITPSKAIDEFVELVRQYDTWEWERNNNLQAKRLNTLFFLISIDEFVDKMINKLSSDEHFEFDTFEKQILEMEEQKIERYINRKKRQVTQVELNNKYAGVVYAESYHSELGNELGKEYPHLDYIVILNISGKRMGFRTIHDDVDVSEIAGYYGGGGHEKASGATMTDEAFKQFVIETFQQEHLREDAKRNRFNQKQSSFGTLYRNQKNDKFLIYPTNEKWKVERNNHDMEQIYTNFEDAERFLKRNEQVWMERDDAFVQYLMEQVKGQ